MKNAKYQKITIYLILIILITTIFVENISSNQMTINYHEHTCGETTDWWPMFCHDAANSAYSSCNVSEKNTVLWNVKTDIMSSSSPAVVDGKVYVTTGYFWDGQILCIDLETGSFLWNYSIDAIWVSPIVNDNFLYAAIHGGRMLCLNSLTGELIWNTTVDPSVSIIEESPAFYNGKIYLACSCFQEYQNNNSALYCLDASDGSILWSYSTGRSIMCSPSIYDGKVYTVGLNNRLSCLDAENGNELWTLPDFFIVTHPFILNDRIYVSTIQGNTAKTVACIKDGDVLWEYHPVSTYAVTTTIVGSNNSIYFGTGTNKVADPGKVVCVDAETGELKWSYTSKDNKKFTSKPSLTKEFLFVIREYLYDVTHISSSICSFDVDTGEMIWYYTIGMIFNNYIYGGITIADNKIIVCSVESDDSGEVWGGVYCFGEGEGNLPPSPPDTDYNKATNQIVIRSTDPEGDKIRYGLSWDSVQTHKVDEWTDFSDSGEEIRVACRQKSGIVGVMAEDEHGAQSGWVSQESKSTTIHILLMNFFNNHPYLYPLLQRILGI